MNHLTILLENRYKKSFTPKSDFKLYHVEFYGQVLAHLFFIYSCQTLIYN